MFPSTKPAAATRRCISLRTPKRRRINYSKRCRSAPPADNSSYRGIRRIEIRNIRQQQPDVAFLFAHQNDAASTTRNDVAALHQLIPNYIKTTNEFCAQQSKPRRKEYVSITVNSRRNQQLVTNSSQLVPDAIPETQRFNLSKRCRLTSTTGSSNQQLVTQSQPHSHNATTASSNLYKCNY
ncbi:hypothetical protein F511_09066 [Dorcoceras hygrometricum]|uniref:Uncharacterized protein n=1 Tax=Dorcoceras hygrometricum TaxID=472368 RepID=A0A2Z7DK91_9LAMI|nr:hypothetical protein F511_09066 [Dorcoceras hygrometricum]